jgi:hypothetical protein
MYCGCNYALLRVLIPRMLSLQSLANYVAWYGSEEDGTAQFFVNIVKLQLLYPAGITADVEFSGPTPYTRYYNFSDTSKYTRWEWLTPRRRWAGAGFLYMSVKEFAYVLARLRLGQGISSDSWYLMVKFRLGLYVFGDTSYLNHNGGAGAPPNGATGGSGWVMFPDGITVVAFHNSSGPVGDVPTAIVDAYNQTKLPGGLVPGGS